MRPLSSRFWHTLNRSAQTGHVGSKVLLLELLQRISAFIGLIILLSITGISAVRADAQYVYDETDRLVEVVDAAGNSAFYQYDDAGNLLSIQRHAPDDLSIAEFTPDSGPVGTVVTIYGTGFSATAANNAITFNGLAAAVMAASPTKLITTAPTGATTGPISVTVGLKTASSAKPFTVTADPTNVPPVITSFTPTIGSVGTPVTITGLNFDTIPVNNNVQFNNLSQATVTSSTLTQINTTVPTNASSGHLNVRTFYGAATSSADFFVLPSGYTAAQVGATARIVADGPSLSVNTGTAGQIAIVLFDGVKGQGLGLGMSTLTTTPASNSMVTLTIYKPDNTVLTTCSVFPTLTRDCNLPLLPADGTYTVLVNPGSNYTASFDLLLSADLTGTLTADAGAQTYASTRVGQNARYTFTGTIGQSLGLGMPTLTTSSAYSSVTLTIYKPDNTLLTTCYMYMNSTRDCNLPLLPASGTYLIFADSGSYTASFDLLLSADLAGTLTTDGAAQTYISPRLGQNARYTFTGSIGQSLGLGMPTLTTSSAYSSVKLTIYKPDNTVLTTCYMYGNTRDCNLPLLPVSGTYLIFADSGSYTASFDLLLSADLTGTPTIDGAAQMFSTDRVGQNARYTFTGATGQRLGLGIPAGGTTSAVGTVAFTVYKPDNTALITCYMFNPANGSDCNLPPLPSSGTYTVLVDPGSYTASFDLFLSADITGTLTTDGAAQAFTSTRVGQNARYTFTGTAGQSLGLGTPVWATTPAGGLVWTTVYKPDNTALTYCYIHSAAGSSCNLSLLPATGTYTIIIDPGTNTASFDLLLSSNVTGTLIAGGDAQTFTTTRVGQSARYNFSGTAGQNVSLLLSNDTFPNSTSLYLYKPDGSYFTSTSVYYSGSGPTGTSTWNLNNLPMTGSYTVAVVPSGTSTGTLSVQIP